ncbi:MULTISPECIES: hypothetical protein [unclassified Acinetobacter]|uniref:hypothetical protein n=1 Tax=unclassified Acinetobacter TaxID=196816 RepID=UPI00244A7973|nr:MULTISPECIES: hypothetical protein [unclassified Acinetobacter]MDH0032570.1 hypothetical protein [Acinetobacter sp. GD04021]MDH0885261.1 hypothetical protein [Acinetobacter sp. GD03873]MDH1084411.1 hypothetical protein [Acinetobacter sp. GD03983]MDH2188299.1 hypothetical protein [Acinetobacter sp. GD03645]MDH2203810.1 hypothetical protein [Acinetobacter sp. GD03647]
MLTQADFEARIVAALDDYEILEQYNAQDPIVLRFLRSIAAFLALFSQEVDVSEVEPFIKTRDRSIIADATNKGILPIGMPTQHVLEVLNRSSNSITLSQGRMIEDNSGSRPWRLLQSVTVNPGETGEVLGEQSEYREVQYTVQNTENFHRVELQLRDDLSLAGITVRDNSNQAYQLKKRWMNVEPLEYAFNLTTDSLRRIFIEFGDDERAGRTAQANQVFTFGILETYGDVDVSRLKDASLLDVLTTDETKVSVRFKQGGIVRQGADPLNISQLRVLATYPALYDENAVFLGNFDYSVRQKFMARCHYIAVWNENEQDRYYGVTYQDINHLHIAVVAKNNAEQANLEAEIIQYIGLLDSLYKDRVRVHAVVEKPFNITLTGRLAAVHDLDGVKAQIKGLLVDRYGRTKLSASRWLVNGFNTQGISTQLRTNIVAFQDNISDFSLNVPVVLNKPHEWVYISEPSITLNIERTAETSGAAWI